MNAAKGAQSHAGTVCSVTMGDGHQSEFLLFKPNSLGSPTESPLIVLIYGGGFITGSKEDMAPLAEALVAKYNATVVCPEYRLAPEYKFPTAPLDIWDFMLWLGGNVAATGANPKAGFVIGGVSAGGNLAAVTAHRVLSSGYPLELTGVFLGIPVLFNADTVPEAYRDTFLSREQNRDARILNGEAIRLIEGYYAMDYNSPDFCPILGPKVTHPKTYFQVAGQDPLRDDGLIYERILSASGTPTKLDVYPGLPHGFNSVLPMLKVSQQANQDLLEGFAWLLDAAQ